MNARERPPPQEPPAEPRQGILRALRHPNFRRYFFGQAISTLGTWIQQVALSWLVYRLTGSAALLGVTAFLSQAPQLVVGPIAGPWIDRYDRRRLLIGVQLALAVQALTLSALTFGGWIGPGLIVAMALFLGVANSLDAPLRQSMLGQLVDDRADLGNAIALNALLFNSARFVGPPIAGMLVAATGEAVCFALNSLSFIALAAAVAGVHVSALPRASGSIRAAFGEGVAHAWRSYPTRLVLAMVALVNLLATPYIVLAPIFAEQVFQGGAQTFGWLLGTAGLGALAAAGFLASRSAQAGFVSFVAIGAFTAALGLAAFSQATRLPLALALMFVVGFGITCSNVSCNTTLQTIVPEQFRGRVVALFTGSLFGMQAVGGLVAGSLAGRAGAPLTLLAGALILLAASLAFSSRLSELKHQINAARGARANPSQPIARGGTHE